MIAEYIGFAALAYLAWSLISVELNYRRVAPLNVVIVRTPIDQSNVIWGILSQHIWSILDRLPVEWSSWPPSIRFTRRGWRFYDKADSHLLYGPMWALVTPRRVYLHIADPDTVHDIFTRRGDFIRPHEPYSKFIQNFEDHSTGLTSSLRGF